MICWLLKHEWIYFGNFWCRNREERYWVHLYQCSRCKLLNLGPEPITFNDVKSTP